MKKRIIKLILFALIMILPFLIYVVSVEGIEDQYDNTFLNAINPKYDRLESIEGKKIVVIGGSSVPFGLRSDLVEEAFGGEYEVVNFGLYASLGTKLMMDLSRCNIGEGDIVILAPELFSETYSLFFNPETTLQAFDGFARKQKHLSFADNMSLLYHYFAFADDKLSYYRGGNAPDPVGIYHADSFNEWGDIDVDRPHNIMNNAVDTNMLIYLDETLLDKDFIDYVNDYAAYVRKQGATIYFGYSPVNVLALRTSQAARAEFETVLSERLDMELFGTIEDFVIDERYFYDTNFHLNSDGALYHTDLFIRTLAEKLGVEHVTDYEVPAPPALPIDETVDVDSGGANIPFDEYCGEPNIDYLDCFEYRLVGSGYQIVGVKAEYRDMTEVIIPAVYEGKNITAITQDAFYGCTDLRRIHIGTTIKVLEAGSFNGCISLEGIYLYHIDGNKLLPPTEGLLNGSSREAKLYILETSNFMSGYSWTNYADKFVYFTRGES